jgi:hypothetical protein
MSCTPKMKLPLQALVAMFILKVSWRQNKCFIKLITLRYINNYDFSQLLHALYTPYFHLNLEVIFFCWWSAYFIFMLYPNKNVPSLAVAMLESLKAILSISAIFVRQKLTTCTCHKKTSLHGAKINTKLF